MTHSFLSTWKTWPLTSLLLALLYGGVALASPLEKLNQVDLSSPTAKVVQVGEEQDREWEAHPVLVIDGKEVVREDFGLTDPFQKAKVSGFYGHSLEDTYQTGVVGTWGISEIGQVQENGEWLSYTFTHIWDFRIAKDGEQTMSWVIYRGDENASPFDLDAMAFWQRIEGRWRVGWRQLNLNSPAFPVLISVFERSQAWKNDDVGQWQPTADQNGPWVWVMKYRTRGSSLELAVPRFNGPDFTFVVDALMSLGGSDLPENFLIKSDPQRPENSLAQVTAVEGVSWGGFKEKIHLLRRGPQR